MPDAGDLRVVIVAADPLARAGLAAMLSEEPGLAVLGRLLPPEDPARELAVFEPDAVLWDIGWDAEAAYPDGLRDIAVPVIFLLPEAAHLEDLLSGQPRGLLSRDADGSAISAALRAVQRGLVVLSQEFAALLIPQRDGEPRPRSAEELTPREQQVLHLIAGGLTNRAMAERLGISEHTVKFHVNSAMGKLGAASRTEAVVLATRLGLISI